MLCLLRILTLQSRMNMGIKDAIAMGIPEAYIDRVLRKYIPNESSNNVEHVAQQQAVQFQDG
jgi:gamma-glutamylcyclotransferase